MANFHNPTRDLVIAVIFIKLEKDQKTYPIMKQSIEEAKRCAGGVNEVNAAMKEYSQHARSLAIMYDEVVIFFEAMVDSDDETLIKLMEWHPICVYSKQNKRNVTWQQIAKLLSYLRHVASRFILTPSPKPERISLVINWSVEFLNLHQIVANGWNGLLRFAPQSISEKMVLPLPPKVNRSPAKSTELPPRKNLSATCKCSRPCVHHTTRYYSECNNCNWSKCCICNSTFRSKDSLLTHLWFCLAKEETERLFKQKGSELPQPQVQKPSLGDLHVLMCDCSTASSSTNKLSRYEAECCACTKRICLLCGACIEQQFNHLILLHKVTEITPLRKALVDMNRAINNFRCNNCNTTASIYLLNPNLFKYGRCKVCKVICCLISGCGTFYSQGELLNTHFRLLHGE